MTYPTNLELAKLFRSVSAALSLSAGDNRFRIIAYDRAADAIEHSSSEVKDLWDAGKLKDLAGIGQAIAAHLNDIITTGKSPHLESILKPFPKALFELMEVPGIGPKNALKFCKAFGITRAHGAIAKLEKAAKKGLIAKLEGFGEDSQTRVLQGITEFSGRTQRLLLDSAHAIVDSLLTYLRKNSDVLCADYLGSLRRQASTVGDIDLSVSTKNPKAVIDYFCKYPLKSRVLEAGTQSASLILPGDRQVDLMVQPPESYGSLLQHFTGSKHHNIALREYALKKGLSLSEHGIKILNSPPNLGGERKGVVLEGVGGEVKVFDSEQKFYNFLGLDYIPPELREGKGEIEAAKNHTLPQLIETGDIKGDLHVHSDFNIEPSHDLGQSSISDLIQAAKDQGYSYIGLTDHNPSVSGHTQGQILSLVQKRTELIQSFHDKFHILNGMEIDIQPDGKLALPDACLDLLDYACVSIHSSFRQSKKLATLRVVRALSHPKVKFLAHPTGRLLNQREGVDLDWDTIFDFCLKNGKWLEIDGWPNRLDLPDVVAHDAIKYGIKLVVDTDSHAASQLTYMRYGISVARRAWCTKSDVINTLSFSDLHKLIS